MKGMQSMKEPHSTLNAATREGRRLGGLIHFFGGPPASAALCVRGTRATGPLPLHTNGCGVSSICGGPPASAALCVRGTRATGPLPLQFYVTSGRIMAFAGLVQHARFCYNEPR